MIVGLSLNQFVWLLATASHIFWRHTNARPDVSLAYRYNQEHTSDGDLFPQAADTSYSPSAPADSYFAPQPSIGQTDNSGFVPITQLNTQISVVQGLWHAARNVDNKRSVESTTKHAFNGNAPEYSASLLRTEDDEEQQFSTPIVSKRLHVHTVPIDNDEQEVVRHIRIGEAPRDYEKVFVDNPWTHSTKAKTITDITPYILTGKDNSFDIHTQIYTNRGRYPASPVDSHLADSNPKTDTVTHSEIRQGDTTS